MANATTTALRTAVLNGIVAALDAKGSNGRVRLYSATYPFGVGEPTVGQRVAFLGFNDPSFGAAAQGPSSLQAQAYITASLPYFPQSPGGTARSYQLLDGDDLVLAQGSVTDGSGSGTVRWGFSNPPVIASGDQLRFSAASQLNLIFTF